MLLSEIITPDCIKIDLEAEDREEVFEELIDVLVNVYEINDREPFLDAIRERESKGTTGIGNGIAIPHAKASTADKSMVVMGISKEGLDYESTDNEPVYLVFLIITQENNPTEHLKILQKIAMLAKQEEIIEKIKSSNDPQQVHDIISDFEEQEV